MSEYKRCYSCSTENESEQKYCSKCGGVNFRIDDTTASDGEAHGSNLDITRTGTGLKIASNSIVLTTGQEVPGRAIAEVVGLVFSAGNAAWTLEGTSNKSNTAMGKATGNMLIQAEQLGADAVIAIQMSIDGSGSAVNRSQTVTLFGTAVKLVPIQE